MHTKRRWTWVLAILAVATLLASACGDDNNKDSDKTTTTGAGGTGGSSSVKGSVTGGGSSFQDGFQQRMIADYKKVNPDGNVVYQKSGSSDGKQGLSDGTLDFAGSDSPVKDDEDLAKKKDDVLYFPLVTAPITISFNLSGVKELNLSPDTVAKIFSTDIKTWDDDAIKADNPDANLPSTKITVVHRSDGSGTTSNFTKYLTAAAPDAWTLGSGETVNWDSSTQGAEKNSGVATAIQGTDGAVGYVDLGDAAKAGLDVAAIKNKAGKFVKPTPAGSAAAAENATVNDDLTFDPINADGDAAYPITSPTYVLVLKTQSSAAKADLLKDYLKYVLTTGQGAAESVLYAKLPTDLAQKAVDQLDQISS
ncbi:MAG: phosphate ABC transporter substrate-binding protein PstS [Acidimicrobiia bacterium]|nr:phosphate ABC transporter substrate-binding protein PstS [Acidimicrobiia bacterium]